MRGIRFLITSMLFMAAAIAQAAEPDLSDVESQFRSLPMESRRLTGPLFWLDGDEGKERLEMYVGKVAEGGNGTFTAESRPHNDWLGPGWYRDLATCLDAAKKNNLTMWIFDEKWWPSGEVAGKVPQQYGSKRLQAEAKNIQGPAAFTLDGCDTNLVAVIAGKELEDGIDGSSLVDLTGEVKNGTLNWNAPAGKWKVMKFTWEYNKGHRRLVDGASRDAVEWYINTVYQPHYDRFKEDFGKSIKGFFYDEPETHGDWGTEVIPMLKERKVDWKKALVAWKFTLSGDEQAAAKYQYQDALAEAWGRTMYGGITDWCNKHGVTSIGHWLEHDRCYLNRDLCAGNMFQVQKYSDMGGIDLVCRQMYPGQRPMGIYQTPKLGSSITHVYGKKDDITMCEIFGAYGQDITYPQMKWLTDQMQVRGINFMIPHAFNPNSPKDTDCPPYFYNGGHEPRWPLYRIYADYTSRLSLMLSGGRHVCPVAFLYLGNSAHVGKYVTPEQMTTAMQDALFDCDWMPYDVFEQDTKLEGKEIKLRQENYRILVVPPVEVIPYETLAKAKEFFDAGGIVVGYGFLPSRSATLGKTSADIADLCGAIWGEAKPGVRACKTNSVGGRSYLLPEKPSPEDIQAALTLDAGFHPTLEVVSGETNNWLHVLHRVKSGRDVFFICNQDHKGSAKRFTFRIHAAGVPECWNAMTGEITSVDYRQTGPKSVEIELTMEPSESILLVFNSKARHLPQRPKLAAKTIELVRDTSVVIKDPECPLPRGYNTLEDCQWIWFPEGNPAVAASPGTRYFRGSIDVPQGKKVARAVFTLSADNEFTLIVNGKVAGNTSGVDAWKTPKEIDITSLLQTGKNCVAVAAVNLDNKPNPAGLIGKCKLDLHGGESISVRTDENWKTSDTEIPGWDRQEFDDSKWKQAMKVASYGDFPWSLLGQDRMWTLSPVKSDVFVGTCEVLQDVDLSKSRIYLEMEGLDPEEAASVTVNGKYAGGFIGRPLKLDVTEHIKRGSNRIRIAPFAPKSARLVY